jgi:hypothetical protein
MGTEGPALLLGPKPLVPKLREDVVSGREALVAKAFGAVADLAVCVQAEEGLELDPDVVRGLCARDR